MLSDVPETYTRYAEQVDQARFTDWLRAHASEVWTDVHDHRFIRQIAADDLNQAVFKRYLVQEYAFVDVSAAAVGYAVGKAPSMDERTHLTDTLSGLTNDQVAYFREVFDALEIPRDQWTNPERAPATDRLRDLVIGAATADGYEEALAPMLAAEWLYATWCGDAAGTVSPETHQGRWIHLHTEPGFVDHAGWLRDQLDEYGPLLPLYRERRVRDLFERTLRCEIEFHDAPYESDPDTE
jgi:Putative transcription activator